MRTKLTLACVLLLSFGCAAKDRNWMNGTLLDEQTQRGTRTVGIPSTYGSGPLITSLPNDVVTYVIDDGKYIWVIAQHITNKRGHPLELTVNGPVKFAIEGHDCYVLDEQQKEHKLPVEKKVLKQEQPPTTPQQ
jgi:hypothetical protein